jgi:hypothetical protein
MHIPRDYKSSVFVKTLRLTQEHYDAIEKYRGLKSRAGKLKEIVAFWLEAKKLR